MFYRLDRSYVVSKSSVSLPLTTYCGLCLKGKGRGWVILSSIVPRENVGHFCIFTVKHKNTSHDIRQNDFLRS
jgi:hypothetical protein